MKRAAFAALCAMTLAAGCGDSGESSSSTTSGQEKTAPAPDLEAVKGYLTDHTARLRTDVATLREDAEAYYDLAEGVDFDYEKLLADHREEVAELVKQRPGRLREGQPGLRGDGGRRRRRPLARRLRRDHRRRRRQLRPRVRRPVRHQDARRQDLQAAGQLQLPDRDRALRHGAEVRRQGRRARPRRRRQGRVRRGAARRRLPTSPPRATSRSRPRPSTPTPRPTNPRCRTR